MQVMHQVRIRFCFVCSKTFDHQWVGCDNFFTDFDCSVKMTQRHTNFHQQYATSPFGRFSSIDLLRYPLIGKLHIFFRLFQNAPTVIRIEIHFRCFNLLAQIRNISKQMCQLVITICTLEIGGTPYRVFFSFIFERCILHTVQNDIGIFDSFKSFIPIPSDLVFIHIICSTARQ